MEPTKAIGGRVTERLVAGQEYRVLSLHPEWAWEIVFGSKTVEYRSWATRYRGRMLIHASTHASPAQYPRSVILGSVELVDCVEVSGEFDWILREPRALETPVRNVPGKLKVWRWTPNAGQLEGSWEGMMPDSQGRPPPAASAPQKSRSRRRAPAPEAEAVTVVDLSPSALLQALRDVAPANAEIDREELQFALARHLGCVLTESVAEWTSEAIERAAQSGELTLMDDGRVRRRG